MASQAGSYGALLVGGILAAAGFSGHSPRDILSGKGSSLKGLISTPPAPGTGAQSTAALTSFTTPGTHQLGGAVNPLPGWSVSRIDQGRDAYGGRKILAPMNGEVLATGAPGWPGGGGVLLKLENGQIWYFYEQLTALVRPHQKVAAGTQIGSGTPGGSIEVGLANAAGVPLAHGEYTEGVVTKFGKKASAILHSWGFG